MKPKRKYNPKQIIKQKVHKFQMLWEVNEAKRIIEMHHLLNGVDPQQSTFTPLKVWMRAHKGDLALALKTQTIPCEQSFHIASKVELLTATGETVVCDFQLATPQTMHLWQFLGDVDSDLYIEESGIKMKWLGFEHELNKYLKSIAGENHEVITNHCCLTCFSSFKSFRHEIEFKSIKLTNLEYGLGVAA